MLGERSVAMFLERLKNELHEPWTLELMAEKSGLARTRFAHYCRKLTNLSPMEYLQRQRVEKARVLFGGNAAIHHRHRAELRVCLQRVFCQRVPPARPLLAARIPRGLAGTTRERMTSLPRECLRQHGHACLKKHGPCIHAFIDEMVELAHLVELQGTGLAR